MFIMGAIFFARVCIFFWEYVIYALISRTGIEPTVTELLSCHMTLGPKQERQSLFTLRFWHSRLAGTLTLQKVPFLTFEVTTASNRTTKMLIPKEDRKKIHQYLFQRE